MSKNHQKAKYVAEWIENTGKNSQYIFDKSAIKNKRPFEEDSLPFNFTSLTMPKFY